MTSFIVSFLFCCFILLPLPSYGGEQQNNRSHLKQIRQRIDQTNKSLHNQQQHELSLLRDLVTINTSLKEIQRRISRLKREQRSGEKKISKVLHEIELGKKDLRSQRRKLQKRLISLYKEGDSGLLKVLFSSNSPTELAQQYEYMSRILANDKVLMATFKKVLAQQEIRLAELEKYKIKQQKSISDEKNEREDARSARQLQAQLLNKVRQNKSLLHAELKKLKEKALRLEALVQRLDKRVEGGGSFLTQKGKLPWPVNGALLVGFGTQKNPEFGTLYESHGIDISANRGTRIQTVSAGKVVFANWFKGYGNLLIVSHAGGYHTLYAQADSLLKEVGDHVESGTALAVSGGQNVYFEIRHNGVPVNPLSWLIPR